MVRIDRVVTRGGDKGETSLGDGKRVPKHAPRVEAFGCVDEANAAIGALRVLARGDAEADAMLARIQNDLFDVGADLCVPGEAGARMRLTDAPVVRLEQEVAAMNAAITPLTSFILPGGTAAAAQAHVARTVVRRAERQAVALAAAEPVNPAVVRFLNRLSDHLFVLSRRLNDNGAADVLWVPGANR
ncbi:MAG: cob(I)yrinic acid a,c-diamide adenosyltransferase [Rhodospirillales bacterium]|nr:cob(I)yrinic acid a,c-diamide adenosyltransferase [Rhodospirillales bacterium]